MTKHLLNLSGVKQLKVDGQKEILGGGRFFCNTSADCFALSGDRTDRCINRRCFIF